jgi:hypothetical protein
MTKWKNPRIGPAFYMSFRSAAEGFAFQEKYPASYPLQTCQAPKPQIPSPIKAIATPISCPQLAILVIERKKKPRRLSRGFLVFAAKQKHLNHLDVTLCSAVTSESNTLRGRSRPKSNDSKTLGLRVGRGSGSSLLRSLRSHSIKLKVQLEYIHTRLAKKPELPPLRMLCDQFAYRVL